VDRAVAPTLSEGAVVADREQARAGGTAVVLNDRDPAGGLGASARGAQWFGDQVGEP
jgi:hypothetical protein